jgi:hypothetical protein
MLTTYFHLARKFGRSTAIPLTSIYTFMKQIDRNAFYCTCNYHVIIIQSTLEQAMKVQRESRRIALLFLWPQRQIGIGVQRQAPATLSPEGLGTLGIGG